MPEKDQAQEPRSPDSGSIFHDRNLWIIFAASLMSVAGITPIAPAFPDISRSLNTSQANVGLVITAYTLPGAVFGLLEGFLADRFGRKKILVPSLLLFAAAGFACTFASTFKELLIFRAVQGAGAAALPFLNVTLIGDLYKGNKRTRAMGLNGSSISVGTATYPLIGGSLALMGWWYPFYIELLAIPVALAVAFLLKNPEPHDKRSLRQHVKDIWNGARRKRAVWLYVSFAVTYAIYFGSYITHFSFILRHEHHASSLLIGFFFTVASAAMGITSSQLGKISQHVHRRTLIKSAFLLYVAGLAIVPMIHSLWWFMLPTIILGVANGINIPSTQDLIAGAASMEERASYMSLTGMALRWGETIGPLAIGAALAPWGIMGVFEAGAGIAAVMFIVGLLKI